MTQIADRLQTRPGWNYPVVNNIEPQIRICLRQMQSITLREMAVSFPWPTREMAGSEVLPIRSMKPAEKQKWLQSIWTKMQEERKTFTTRNRASFDAKSAEKISSGRFEAPSSKSPRDTSPRPSVGNTGRPLSTNGIGGTLSRRNATQSIRHGRNNSLSVPQKLNNGSRESVLDDRARRYSGGSGSRSPSPPSNSPSPLSSPGLSPSSMMDGDGDGEVVTLSRMMTISRRPPQGMLGEALSLALFRMKDGE